MSVVLEYDKTKRAKRSLAIAGVCERPVSLQEILMMIFLRETY